MGNRMRTPAQLACVAERFKALGEPARLQILQALRAGERNVSELVEQTGLSQANLSKHLQLLHREGFVARRKAGLFTCYRLADKDVFRLCDLMCGRVERQAAAQHRLLATDGEARRAS